MASSLLGYLVFFFALFVFLAVFAIVAVFVIVGAVRIYRSRAALSTIDVSDGLDESELKIIRDVFAKQKQQEDAAAVKARMAKAAAAV